MLKACRAEIESSEIAVSRTGHKTRKEATIRCANLHVKYRQPKTPKGDLSHHEVKDVVSRQVAHCFEAPGVFDLRTDGLSCGLEWALGSGSHRRPELEHFD